MTPDYSMMQQLLRTTLPEATPAALHGLVTGLLSSGAPDIDEGDIATLMQGPLPPVVGQLVNMLIESTRGQLLEPDFSFQLLLPPDDMQLVQRVQALGHWCESFTAGFSAGFMQSETTLGSEGREALTDIAQLASLSEELEDDIEDEENDYMELVEYVRMAAIALFQQLAAVEENPEAAAEISPFMAPDSDDQLLH
jgi:uncharacterized protein YgfB (UPF0149 family)